MNDSEDEIFRRSSHLLNDFVAEVKAPPTGIVIEKLIKLDETLQNVIDLIQNLIKSLDKIKNKEEITFWNSQIMKLEEDVGNQVQIHVESFEKDPENDREYLERASQELLGLKRAAALDWKGFANVKGYPIESEVSGVKGNDNENLDNVNETEDVTKMVEDENELDVKLDDKSLVVEKVGDIPEASEKEIDDSLKEKVSHDIYAPEAASNDVKELLDNPEATEADVVSSVNETTQPRYELNACFAKEMRIEHDPDDTSEDSKDECIDINEIVEVVAEKGEGQKPDSKSDHDIAVIDDDVVLDVKIETFKLSDKEGIVKVNEEDTDEDVRGYEVIAVEENDDQITEVNEDILDDETKNFAVDVEKNFKVKVEIPNEFIEVERNVVKLLYEGTFLDNSEEIVENLKKFPESEIRIEEVTSDEENDLNVDPQVESNSYELILDDDLDENQDIPEDGIKAQKDNTDSRFTVAKNVISLGTKKPVVDESLVQEHGPDADSTNVIDGNIHTEFKTNVKVEEDELDVPASSSKKAVKLKIIAKLEKLIFSRKVATSPVNAITMDKYWFDKEHNCMLAKVLVVITATKPMDMPVNYSQLLNDMIRLDIDKKLPSFPWRPGDLLCWCVNFEMVNVFVFQLMCVLLQSQVYTVMNTAAYNKFCMEVEMLHPKLSLSVSLLDTINLNLYEEEVDNMQVDQTASADNLMVLLTLLSQAEVFFPGERVYYSLLRLKLFPQE